MEKTKKQEQEALNKIKEILADFGPDTYLGMAFDGVIDDAQTNIDCDFGNSYKERYDKAMAEGFKVAEELEKTKQALEKTKKFILSVDILNEIHSSAIEYQNYLIGLGKQEAERIVELADDTSNGEFSKAVHHHRLYAKRAKKQEEIIDAVRFVLLGARKEDRA